MFDSGFGGVSVLAETVRLLPAEQFLFLGDNRNAPYGDRAVEEVLDFTRQGVDRLIRLGCKAIVIACNTATSAAAGTLRRELPLPIIGMEPALKPAALLPRNGAVLVMATAMTLRLKKFRSLMERYGRDAVPVPLSGACGTD
jgi:glutamate racemase